MVNWRIEGIDEQGRTRFVEYERGDYRADPITDRELGEEEPLYFLGHSPSSRWRTATTGRAAASPRRASCCSPSPTTTPSSRSSRTSTGFLPHP